MVTKPQPSRLDSTKPVSGIPGAVHLLPVAMKGLFLPHFNPSRRWWAITNLFFPSVSLYVAAFDGRA